MFSSFIARFIHTGRSCWAAEKSLLASLRKKTGYTFSNCKKALELHNNDLVQAEKWLKEQAQAMGWSKATKLEGRQTSQGLVAVVVDKNNGAMVELNCETDFVAKNKNFQEMVEAAAKACLQFVAKQPQQQCPITKIGLDQEQLKTLPASDGKPLADHVALMIGTVGENASLRRAVCFKGDTGILLTGYAHPSSTDKTEILLGKFGALLAYKSTGPNTESVDVLGKKLCQHIVGMNPSKLGSEKYDKPAENSDDEKCLIYQDFVLDESMKIKDVLTENGIEIVEFRRFECGEQDDIMAAAKPVENVQTCQ